MAEVNRSSGNKVAQFKKQSLRSRLSMMLVFLLIVILFIAGFLFFKTQSPGKGTETIQQSDQQAPARPTELKIAKPTESDHWTGSKDAKFVLVEYSDLECPFCKSIHPTLKRLLTENEGKIAWVFRHYPLSFHAKAQKLAEAVECASDQDGDNAFWKMTEVIYNKMPDIELTGMADLANSIGLDGAALQTCMDSGKLAQKVKDQQAEGTKAGVQPTPSTVIYNVATGKTLLVEGDLPYDQFKTQLDAFMK